MLFHPAGALIGGDECFSTKKPLLLSCFVGYAGVLGSKFFAIRQLQGPPLRVPLDRTRGVGAISCGCPVLKPLQLLFRTHFKYSPCGNCSFVASITNVLSCKFPSVFWRGGHRPGWFSPKAGVFASKFFAESSGRVR